MQAEQPKSNLHPAVWVASLYLAMALPFCAVTAVSSYMYISFGLSASQIGLLSGWLILPWTLKPFFSPFLEMWGQKKQWVLFTQLLMGAGYGVLAFVMPVPFIVQASLALLMIIGFNSSVHDTAADGLYIDNLDKADQSKYIGVQSGSWTAGQVVAQGGMVGFAGYLEEHWGIVPAWVAVWGIFGVAMVVSAVWHRYALPNGVKNEIAPGFDAVKTKFREVGTDFFQKKHIWWLIAFAFIYRSAEGQVTTIARVFLRAPLSEGGLGLSTWDVGLAYGTLGTIGNVAGALAGGWYASKVGLKRSIVPLALIFNIPNGLFTYLAYTQETNYTIVILCAMVEKFTLGMGFVAMTLVLMQQMAPGRYSTAHYGYATALMGAGMMIPTQTSGFVSEALSFSGYFVYILAMGLPSIIIAWLVPLQDDVKAVNIPEGIEGDTQNTSAWGTAKAAGSFYLLLCFSASVYSESITLGSLVFFGILAVIGWVLAVSAFRTASRGRALADRAGGTIRHQAGLASVIAVLAFIGWGVCFLYLCVRYSDVRDAREDCQNNQVVASCELACDNDSTLAPCKVVHEAKAKAFAATPENKDAAKAALDAWQKYEGISCTAGENSEACMKLGIHSLDPGEWKQSADAGPNHEDAQRYFGKACLLGNEIACDTAKSIYPTKAAYELSQKLASERAKLEEELETTQKASKEARADFETKNAKSLKTAKGK